MYKIIYYEIVLEALEVVLDLPIANSNSTKFWLEAFNVHDLLKDQNLLILSNLLTGLSILTKSYWKHSKHITGIEGITQIFSQYILVDISIDAHHSYKTKNKYYDHLFIQFFLNIVHHVF